MEKKNQRSDKCSGQVLSLPGYGVSPVEFRVNNGLSAAKLPAASTQEKSGKERLLLYDIRLHGPENAQQSILVGFLDPEFVEGGHQIFYQRAEVR